MVIFVLQQKELLTQLQLHWAKEPKSIENRDFLQKKYLTNHDGVICDVTYDYTWEWRRSKKYSPKITVREEDCARGERFVNVVRLAFWVAIWEMHTSHDPTCRLPWVADAVGQCTR